jgi:hypothetical protein
MPQKRQKHMRTAAKGKKCKSSPSSLQTNLNTTTVGQLQVPAWNVPALRTQNQRVSYDDHPGASGA